MSSLNFRHRPTIGVLAGWQVYKTATNFSYLLPAFGGISRAAKNLGCNLLLGCGLGTSAKPDDPLRPAWPLPDPDVDFVPIGPWNTDGIVIFNPLHSQIRSQYIQGLITSGHPIIFIGAGEIGPTLAANNRGGVFDAIGHLVNHGHQNIAFIAGSMDDLSGDTGERLEAYKEALTSFGLKFDQKMVAFGRHVYDGGYSAMQQIINSGPDFTAVLASNDESALGAIKALRDSSRRIPEDVAVIGFDNRLEGAANKPSLSSINIPLFTMGHQAVGYLIENIVNKTPLPEIVRFDTRLIVRDSCGCNEDKVLFSFNNLSDKGQPIFLPFENHGSQWIAWIAESVFKLAKNLDLSVCQTYSQYLVNSFSLSIENKTLSPFNQTFDEILQETMMNGDDASIWWNVISLIGAKFKKQFEDNSSANQLINEILDQARLNISIQIQKKYRHFVSDQRWISNQLTLLTDSLMTALNEEQIYEILAHHLPQMNIDIAQIAFIEAEEDNPIAWSSMRNALDPKQAILRFNSTSFPPDGLFSLDEPYQLALIPLKAKSAQIGYLVFGIDSFDLYGSIVQQLGGALSTAELYRQALEGRRLAEEANRMKSRFLSTVSHELRTPSNLIVGLSELVLQTSYESEKPLPEPLQKDIERINTYAQHLNSLIGDLLDLATSDAGKLRLNNSYIELGPALSIVAESGHQLALDKGLSWEAALPASGPWVWGDQTRLRQIVLNLINNAIKFTDRGSVSLTLETNPNSVRVSVKDTGLGIPIDEQASIFDEFQQTERSFSLGYGGLGLGLAISKQLVEMHGGKIGVHSTGQEGDGSTFYFSLPTVHTPDNQTVDLTTPLTITPTVMVLTSDPESSKHFCEKLTDRGLQVQVKLMSSLTDFEPKSLAAMPDAILLDMSSTSELSWETIKTIKNSRSARGIPLMFYKSKQDDGSVLELDYLTKPIELTELTKALDQQWLLTKIDHPAQTILVVDDEPNTLEMHARIVETQSISNQVLRAHNGREALEILHAAGVDLVLLDLLMPEMDGFQVLEAMRENEQTRNIPVIILTGKVITEDDVIRLNQGVASILEKGIFSLDETVDHISSALERKRTISREAQLLVRKAMVYIHDHYAESITRSDIAQSISISEDYLTFCFRQEFGKTPVSYLQHYRINQAKILLRDTERTITDIAHDVGFSDPGYFSRVFQHLSGMTPNQFRKNQ